MSKSEKETFDPAAIDELCNYLGYELDGNMCQELRDFIETCPQWKDYISSVESTVHICKKLHTQKPIPDQVKSDLLAKIKNVCKKQ
ncbi:MAG: hypothetical protein AAFP70_12685 [Calditrichota bacterium]